MFKTKAVDKIKTHILRSIIFFFRLWDKVEKYCRAAQATDDNMAQAHCFSTAAMVARTHLKVTLYKHCLSCSIRGRQDFATALKADDNRSATNSRDKITISASSIVTKLYVMWTYSLTDLQASQCLSPHKRTHRLIPIPNRRSRCPNCRHASSCDRPNHT